MSLDISLKSVTPVDKVCNHCNSIYQEYEEYYQTNITHNLNTMAGEAGIYEALWRPYMLQKGYIPTEDYDKEMLFESMSITYAKDIIEILEKGLKDLKKRPKYFEKFNSSNGWGMYEHFVPFVEGYLQACKDNPEAIIKVDR